MSSFLLLGFLLPTGAVAQPEPLLVAAASDLSHLEPELKALAGMSVRFVFGSSGQFAQQIRNGAPYDLYLSANEQFVRDLAASGQVAADSVTVYARGRIAMWSKSGKPDLKQANLISIGNPKTAPYGLAALAALDKLEIDSKKIVYAESVRQALQFAESGNADVAVVAWPMVKDRGGVLLDAKLHLPIVQAGGVVANSKKAAAGRQFLSALVSAKGQRMLREAGFEAVR